MKESENYRGNQRPDLTPMVDVTFLLLTIFMVTAWFTMQKTYSQNAVIDETHGTGHIN